MKKTLLSALLMMMVALTAMAIPAKRGMSRTLTLANGSTVEATLVGDEFGHYWLTDDGSAYIGVGQSYVPVNRQDLQRKAQVRRDKANKRRVKQLEPGIGQKDPNTYTGHKKGLVILVNFANQTFQEEHTK